MMRFNFREGVRNEKTITILFIALALANLPAITLAADISKHNPTGDDDVERGWKEHQDSHKPKQQEEKKQETSTSTETTDQYGKKYLEEQVQGTKEPKVNRTY